MKADKAMKVLSPSVEASLSSAIANDVKDVNITIHVARPSNAKNIDVKASFVLNEKEV